MTNEPRRAPRSEPPTISIAELDQDPHGIFRRHRPITPLIRREDGIYAVIRAADVERLATDPRTRQMETELGQSCGVVSGPLFDFYKHTMLLSNGPTHRKRRAPVSRAFAYRLITALRPRIRAVADEIITSAHAAGEMNLLDDYAAVIPARIISEMLGLPAADIPRFTSWVYTLVRALGSDFTRDEVPALEVAAEKLTTYVETILATRRGAAGDDFLTSYASAVEEDGTLSPIETLIQIVTLIVAGSDTTRAAMTLQTALLLQHREQWDAVCQDNALIPGAVSESLRYEPAVGSFPRFSLDDIEVDGYVVPRNCRMFFSTMSALRDPARYADPDSFNIRRTDQPRQHLVFGTGVHRCLGEALARAELEEGLAALAARIPLLRIAGDPPVIRGHRGIRTVTGMRVSWPAAAS